jgi:hypothetical protein
MVLFLFWYKLLTIVGENLIDQGDMPNSDVENANDPIFFFMTMVILVGIFLLLAFISNLKYSLFKDDSQNTGPELFLDHIVKNVFWSSLVDKYNSENADISQSDQAIEVARGEANFIHEVVRSYAFRDSGWKNELPEIEYKISVVCPAPLYSEIGLESEIDLLINNRSDINQSIYFSNHIQNHIEMMDKSLSSDTQK